MQLRFLLRQSVHPQGIFLPQAAVGLAQQSFFLGAQSPVGLRCRIALLICHVMCIVHM